MARILLVKTSSLGDVVHNLPVVSDVLSNRPDTKIDWVVETSFAAIARLHPGVDQIIPVALRRWRRELLRAESRREICLCIERLREREYDAVIDTQGLLKSAVVTAASRGPRYGLDWKSSREPLRPFYDRTFSVPWGQHAVARNRSLAAQALDYAVTTPANYGISTKQRAFTWLPAGRYAVLLHATSADSKLWSEANWQKLSKYLNLNNIFSVLPWGNVNERSRSQRIAAAMPGAVVAPALALDDLAALLAQAHIVAGVDTGLTHLAAALKVPTVGIYGATDPAATGIHGCPRAVNLGSADAPPSVPDVIAAIEALCA